MLKSSSLFRLGLVLLTLQLVVTTLWLWQVWSTGSAQDEAHRRLFRTHSVMLTKTLQPALVAADTEHLADLLETARQQLPELQHLGFFDAEGQELIGLGAPLPLRNFGVNDKYRERTSGDLFVIEQGIDNAKAQSRLGILQTNYSLLPYSPIALLAQSWPALVALTLSLLGFMWLLKRSLWPLNDQIHALGQQLETLRSRSIPETVEIKGPLEPLCEQINILQRFWYRKVNTTNKQLAELQAEQEGLRKLLLGLDAVLLETIPRTERIKEISHNVERIFDYGQEYWVGNTFLQNHIHPTDFALLQEYLIHPSSNDDPDVMEIRLRDKRNEWRWMRLVLLVQGRDDNLSVRGALIDLSETKALELRAIELSNTDALTGLYNRQYFLHCLKDHSETQQRHNGTGAILFMDLDRFEFVNAMFGQHVGDQYLCQFAKHLRDLFKDSGVLGRVGGDEFAVIIDNHDVEQASRIAQQLLAVLRKVGFDQDNTSIPFSASIGIALFPEHSDDPNQLLTLAAAAMYQAKKQGRGTYQITATSEAPTDDMDLGVIWDERLRKALEQENLSLFFQPIIDLDIGMIHHYECFLRLYDDIGRSIEAQVFLPPAERIGLRDKLERWGLINALRTQGVNARIGQQISLLLNLSSRQINQTDLVETILTTSEQNGTIATDITFEVSAETAANNIERVRALIASLREHGYRFVLDNFGIGALSFDDLRLLKVDYLKIDSDLVSKIVWSPADRAMVQAIADLAKGLNLKLIAMGVESDQVLKELRKLEIGFGQGRLFAEPAPRFHEHERIILADQDVEEWG